MYSTTEIVKMIRCETKRALDKFAQTRELQRRLYDGMSIGYKFTFTMSENNKGAAGAAFKLPVSHGTFTLGVAGGMDKERLGEREFTIIDTFKEARDDKVCSIEATRENYEYPITGVIGIEEVIRTFLELQGLGLGKLPPVDFDLKFDKSTKKDKKDKADTAKTEDFVETFEFTTTIRASANPKIVLSPVGSGFNLTEGSINVSADRIDRHKVVITLAPNYTAALQSLQTQDLSSKLQRNERAVRFVPLQ
jgi:hypothetical protein